MQTHSNGDKNLARFACASTIAAVSILLVVVLLLHPERVGTWRNETTASVMSEFELIAETKTWILAHALNMVAFLLFLFGAFGISAALAAEPSSTSWGRLGFAILTVTVVVGLGQMAIEISEKRIVDLWTGAPADVRGSALFSAQALEYLHRNVGRAFALSLACTSIVYGVAFLGSRTFNRLIGIVAIASGALLAIFTFAQLVVGYFVLSFYLAPMVLVGILGAFVSAAVSLWKMAGRPSDDGGSQ